MGTNYIFEIHIFRAAALKAIQAGELHLEITDNLNKDQQEQKINSSRAAAIYFFENAKLLFRLTAKDIGIKNNNDYERALTCAKEFRLGPNYWRPNTWKF